VRVEHLSEDVLGAEWLSTLCVAAEVSARLGRDALMPWLYEQLLPFRSCFAIDGIGAHLICIVEHPLALMARALGRPEASEHFAAAIDAYARVGASLLLNVCQVDAGERMTAPTQPARRGEFRHDGDAWIVGFEGEHGRVRHSKGMTDLARLLGQPG